MFQKIKIFFGKAYFFIPGTIVLLFIFLYPLIKLITSSFQNFNLKERTASFIGIQNYITILSDKVFLNALKNNLFLIITVIPIIIFLSVIFSVIIYHSKKLMRTYQIIVFAPYLLSIAVTGILIAIVLQKNGILNEFLSAIGLKFIALDWLGDTKIAIFSIALVIIWREMGFGTTLLLARMLALSKELEDAIEVDGANWWQKLVYLYLPHLRGIISFYITMLIINLATNVFSYVYVISKGGPANSTQVFEYYVYLRAFVYSKIQLASAASVLLFVILFFIIFRQIKSARINIE